MNKLFVVAGLFVGVMLASGGCALIAGNEVKELGDTGILGVLLWNVNNLFDGADAGTEYAEYTAAGGWNEQKYAARILSISQAIEKSFEVDPLFSLADGSPPAVIGLVEVENLQVLEDLASGTLARYGYNWIFFGNLPGSSVGIGAMSRLPIEGTRVHSITLDGETTPRPVLEFHVEAGGEAIVFFLCHWKSKLGGDEATEAIRRSSARVINRRIAELRREDPSLSYVIFGDLNENHDEFYRISGAMVSALLPDDAWAAKLAVSENRTDFLILSGEKPPRSNYFDDSLPVFYTPWGNELSDGSYYYKKEWETIDHFLLSTEFFNGFGWEYLNCRVLNKPPFVGSSGYPEAYVPRIGTGLSDHLPLMLYLKKAPETGNAE